MDKAILFSKFPFIQTSEITLRKVEITDLDDLYSIYSNEKLFKYRPGIVKKNKSTVENMISHFERDFGKKKIIYLGICINEDLKRIIGVAEIFDFDEKVNMATIGYTLNEDYWGHGFATKTVEVLRDYLLNAIGVNRVQAFVMPDNIKSRNVLERNRFTKEGTIRQGAVWTGKGIVDLDLFSFLKSDNA
ncbi:GNAT family N-acetyltransferase [Clostridium sp. MSJ-4]|uniref:GNAT family N-acetyltransferase n=1 Tax=Clostridium simiarum TaxID=2841506 RepID=A0ABS6F4F7_9CLOT|nr:GNAT family protein [Clostridium simiarum]MBU5593148.1 GNAT family N-acetyltransferase [Clostridium simiarum]